MKIFLIIAVLSLIGYVVVRWGVTRALRPHFGPGFLLSYLGPILIGIATSSAAIYQCSIALLFYFTTRDRMDAACRFVTLALLLPNATWNFSLGPVYLVGLTPREVLSIALLVKCAVVRDRATAPVWRTTIEDGFVAVFLLALWWGGTRFPSLSMFLRGGVENALFLALPYLALRQSVRTQQEFMRVIGCVVMACSLLCVMAFYEWRFSWSLFGVFREVSDRSGGLNLGAVTRGGTMRAGVTMSSALMLAVVLMFGFVGALYCRRYVRRYWMYPAAVLLILGGMIVTQSRGNIALVGLGLAIFFVLRRRWGYASLICVGAPVIFGILLAAARVSPAIAGFLNVNTGESNEAVYDYRQLLLRRGLEVAATHRWSGASLDRVVGQLSDIRQGEGIVDLVNTYLTVYLVSGLVGFIPFITLFAMIWWKLITARVNKFGDRELIDLRAFALTALAVVTVQLAFMSFIDRMPLCLALALATSRIVGEARRRLRRSARQSAAAAEMRDVKALTARPQRPAPAPG